MPQDFYCSIDKLCVVLQVTSAMVELLKKFNAEFASLVDEMRSTLDDMIDEKKKVSVCKKPLDNDSPNGTLYNRQRLMKSCKNLKPSMTV